MCSNNTFIPEHNGNWLIGNRASIVDQVCCVYEQLLHPVQCTAWKTRQCNSIDIFSLPRMSGILSNLGQLHYFWGENCFRYATRKYSNCLYQSWRLHTLLSYHYKKSILDKRDLFWNQAFHCRVVVAFKLPLGVSFSGQRLPLWVQHDEVRILILPGEKSLSTCNVAIQPDSKRMKNNTN